MQGLFYPMSVWNTHITMHFEYILPQEVTRILVSILITDKPNTHKDVTAMTKLHRKCQRVLGCLQTNDCDTQHVQFLRTYAYERRLKHSPKREQAV